MRSLLCTERGVVADFLLELCAYDREKLYLADGFSSLFDYCVRDLELSKASAYRRTICAHLLGQFPQVEPFLRDGRICVTHLALLKDVLSVENADVLLAHVAGRTTDEIKHLVAALKPQPALRDCIRRMPVAQGSVAPQPVRTAAAAAAPSADSSTTPSETRAPSSAEQQAIARAAASDLSSASVEAGDPRDRMRPLSATLHRISITVDQAFMDELAEVRLALSHKFPKGQCAEIIREGFRLILKEAHKRRALTDRPRAPKEDSARASVASAEPKHTRTSISSEAQPSKGRDREALAPRLDASKTERSTVVNGDRAPAPPRERTTPVTDRPTRGAIPASVKRAVWQRDQARCTFEGPDGMRCGSGYQVEIEHRVPVARGGASTIDNLTLYCRAHNQYRADLVFGPEWMAARRSGSLTSETAERMRPPATDHSARRIGEARH